MKIKRSKFPLQRFIHALPKPLRRIKIAYLLASIIGSPYHCIRFKQGKLIGNILDKDVANSLVQGTFADYGYFALASRLLKSGDVHVDLGANYGFHTFGLLESPINRAIKYVLIDANPDCVACLNESAKLHAGLQAQVFHTAAAVKAGDIKFTFIPSVTGGGHIGSAVNPWEAEITVPASPLDDLFEDNGIARIALLKMDIEGSEVSAMQSLQRMLSSHRVDFVYFEVNPFCLELQQSSPEALFAEFVRHGYRLFWPYDGIEWILQSYGSNNTAASDFRRCTIGGSQPHQVIEFDQSCYQRGQLGQCDLLAISPKCQLEES